MTNDDTTRIPCPFVYANGRACSGYIERVEAYKADLSWTEDADGGWRLSWGKPRSHYHLFCSEKGNHAGYKRQDDPRMKVHFRQLPPKLQEVLRNAPQHTG